MPTPVRPEDAFADQLEWLSHRYDPGYFLGGTLRPELRLSLGVRAKRLAAVLALGKGLGALGILVGVWIASGIPFADPWSLSSGGLSLLVARKMWTAAQADARGVGLDLGDEARRVRRTTSMIAVATCVTFVGALLAVLASAALRSLLSGELAVPVGLAVSLLIAVLLRTRGSE